MFVLIYYYDSVCFDNKLAMVRVEHFWQDNGRLIYDISSLENITVSSNIGSFCNRLKKCLHEKYMELLNKFEDCFPKIITGTHFFYWSFIRIKIAKNHLEMGDTFSGKFYADKRINLSK